MIEVGTNSYVSVEDADQYVSTFYRATDDERMRWEACTEEDKEILLLRSTQDIELLPFTGRKSRATQSLSFPRWPQLLVPKEIVFAQVEEAVALLNDDMLEDLKETYMRLKRGIRGFTLGNFSESYRVHNTIDSPIISEKASAFLARFLGGGYRI